MSSVFSNGFEEGNFTAWTNQPANALTVQSTTKNSGTYACKTVTNGASGECDKTVTALGAGGTYYARCYINATSTATTNCGLLEMENSGGTGIGIAFTGSSGNLELITTTGSTIGSTVALPTGGWHYIELSYTYNTGAVVARLDGTNFATGSTTASLALSSLRCGDFLGSSDTGHTWYQDDFALDNATWPGAIGGVTIYPDSWFNQTSQPVFTKTDIIPY